MDAWLAAHRLSLSLALVVVALLGAGAYLGSRQNESPLVIAIPTQAASAGGPRAFISGEVTRPGVYLFEQGDRVEQLVALAGGFTAEANVDAVNLALRLKDEQQVQVPRLAPTAAAQAASPGTGSGESRLVNLNTASGPDLEALPGIGPVTAQRIIDHRTQVGPFSSPEEIHTLKIVNSSTFEKIRDRVTVR